MDAGIESGSKRSVCQCRARCRRARQQLRTVEPQAPVPLGPTTSPRWCSGAAVSLHASSSTWTMRRGRLSWPPSTPTPRSRSTSEPGSRRRSAIWQMMVCEAAGYSGKDDRDTSRPDGQPCATSMCRGPRRRSALAAQVPLAEGLRRTVESFRTGVPIG